MKITIVDMSGGKPLKPSIGDAVRAVQRQIREDFEPVWDLRAEIRLVHSHPPQKIDSVRSTMLRSDGVIYVSRDAELGRRGVPGIVGYHLGKTGGLCAGFVFPDVAQQWTGLPWSVALSHEVLEMIVDPDLNLLVGGPHPDPKERRRTVLYAYEVCDSVQSSTYSIDGVQVGNFVTPQYFKKYRRHPVGPEPTNFLAKDLAPFGVLDNGTCQYFDPKSGDWQTWLGPGAGAKGWAHARDKIGVAPRTWRRQRRAFFTRKGGGWGSLDGRGCFNGGPSHKWW